MINEASRAIRLALLFADFHMSGGSDSAQEPFDRGLTCLLDNKGPSMSRSTSWIALAALALIAGAFGYFALGDPKGTALKEYALAAWENRAEGQEEVLLGL